MNSTVEMNVTVGRVPDSFAGTIHVRPLPVGSAGMRVKLQRGISSAKRKRILGVLRQANTSRESCRVTIISQAHQGECPVHTLLDAN